MVSKLGRAGAKLSFQDGMLYVCPTKQYTVLVVSKAQLSSPLALEEIAVEESVPELKPVVELEEFWICAEEELVTDELF